MFLCLHQQTITDSRKTHSYRSCAIHQQLCSLFHQAHIDFVLEKILYFCFPLSFFPMEIRFSNLNKNIFTSDSTAPDAIIFSNILILLLVNSKLS